MQRRGSGLLWIGAALLAASLNGAALAQVDPGDHAAHHPGQAGPPARAAAPAGPGGGAMPSTSAPAPQPGGGCGGMMGCMGGGPRPFYASLLDMPAITPEARRAIQVEAERRIGWGAGAIAAGQARLEAAFAANDVLAAGAAAGAVREGLLNVESGTAMLRAAANGTPPRAIALTWFRDQLSLPAPEAAPMVMDGGIGPWGLSWYHLTTMALLIAFVGGTLLIQYARMRRVGGLVQRLATAAAGARPAPAAGPPSPGPAAPPPTEAAPLPVSGPPAAPVPAAGPAPSPAAATAAAKRPWSGRLRLAAVFPETPNVKTFRLVSPESGDVPFAFMPGQFLTVSAEIDGKTVRRSYTIASSPTQRSYVEVTVKREDQGVISRHLHDNVVVGDLLDVSAPSGVFTFTGTDAESIVLIAGGVGITPMMSVARYLTDTSYPGEIYFLYGARSTADFIFREELEYLQKRHPNLHVAATMSRAQGTAWMGAEGPITKEFIARAVPEIARRRVHLCGPPPMMESVKAALAEFGVPKEQVKTEAFGPARGVTPGTAAHLPAPAPAAPPAPAPASTPAAPSAAAVPRVATAEVLFTKSGKSGALAPDQTVLEAAEAIGVAIDYSCRVGICGACKVPLLKGEVTMEVEEGLPPEDKACGIILACQAKSVGSLEVEA
ncbi:FAD-binding oxidoreductase [Roseicella aquatilis]|uniref:2Fe-2S iron-sulfur cluster binding domain-containing protein n=1 Tax=Roseicella aquatilis TaxID=2527868 RepID=A0A4R4DMT9_9PROT|nr:FAD-binding oxidoreductase [Roseicella aquatilis]TCZ61040.1 2Fe-2S iron-sulfur cluster binding domain-containing protein [Roseicella aquatilis]